MFGHSPASVGRAIAAQAERGLTVMLPSADAVEVGPLLAERFGLPFWQMATTASDANRFVLRWARAVTGRKHIVVFNGCYHGTVDDTLVDLADGRLIGRNSLLGQVYDVTEYTRVIEFNDLPGLATALADGQVACVLTTKDRAPPGHSGIGTTLSGNALSLAALRANLAEVMTPAAYRRMLPLAEQLADGLRGIIARHDLPWCVTQIGARCEFQFRAQPPQNGREAEATFDTRLERTLHLYLLNRGVMITPFHNMMLVCPDTEVRDLDRLLGGFAACLAEITVA